MKKALLLVSTLTKRRTWQTYRYCRRGRPFDSSAAQELVRELGRRRSPTVDAVTRSSALSYQRLSVVVGDQGCRRRRMLQAYAATFSYISLLLMTIYFFQFNCNVVIGTFALNLYALLSTLLFVYYWMLLCCYLSCYLKRMFIAYS